MLVRIPLIVIAAALAAGPVVTAHADDGVPSVTQYCRITSLTADGGPQETVTSVPRPLSADECRAQGGTVTDTAPLADWDTGLGTGVDASDVDGLPPTGFTMTP
ncbi:MULTISPECIES: hypothetical protein [unclassified Streptomyces]|uniref:hypothetical protein n=1 Tax=unclassified Streptomyces TaxID=2593676 RepID=UPI000DBA3D86|nr:MULTISPECIES: hypothetical protein [unclassified Streptomyces]MYT74477.1 hypothetical protein [Streptomyces sp. SID8367]RAJ91456.1 hypothetical protein K377_00221 [Streptomyces sp. PsTaAH-137]